MTPILVTGGAGFIGTALTAALLQGGRPVVLVDRAGTGRQAASLAELQAQASPGALRVVRADLADLDLGSLLRQVGAVVHLAGRPGVQTSWAGGFGDHLQDNVACTQRLLEAALDAPLQRVVVASSSSVYGEGPASGAAAEVDPVRPASPYGVAKATVEMLIGTYAARGVPAVGLRYFTVYGRRQRPDMAIARMLDALGGGPAFPLRGDGRQRRDLTHVDDVVEATIAALSAPLPPGTLVNVGSGRPVALREVIDLVGAVAGRPVPVHAVAAVPGDPARTHADLARARRLLGWSPRVALPDGIQDQARWARSTPPTLDRSLR